MILVVFNKWINMTNSLILIVNRKARLTTLKNHGILEITNICLIRLQSLFFSTEYMRPDPKSS